MEKKKKKQMGWLETGFVIEIIIIGIFLIAYYGYLLFSHV